MKIETVNIKNELKKIKKKKRKPSRRKTMRNNNDLARNWMIKNGYEEIWLKPHTRFLDMVWKENVGTNHIQVLKYQAQDLWNCFDGIAWFKGKLVFLAIGDRWKKIDEIEKFTIGKSGFNILMLKVNKKKEVEIRLWEK